MRIRYLWLLVITGSTVPLSGMAQRTWHPNVTGVSLNVVQHGATVTVSGSDLAPPGWRRELKYPLRYSSGLVTVASPGFSSTQVPVVADRNMRGDSLRFEFVVDVDSVAAKNPIPVAERTRFIPTIVVQSAPALTFTGSAITPDVGSPFFLMSVNNGQGVVKGRNLRKSSLPALSLGGTPLNVLIHFYQPTGTLTAAANCCGNGADAVFFTAPSAPASGWLVLDNLLGRDSMRVVHAVPPMPQHVVAYSSNGTSPLPAPNTLYRGQTYAVRGQHLSIVHSPGPNASIKRGSVSFGGTNITPSFGTDTMLVFTVPSSFSAGTAVVAISTPAGSTNVGTFNVSNLPVPIHVTALQQVPSVITATQSVKIQAIVSIPPGADKTSLGNLVLTTPGTAAGVLKVKTPVAITGPLVQLEVSGEAVQTSSVATLRVSHEANGLNGVTTQAQQVSLTVRPPHPVRIDPPSQVVSGTTTDFTVLFDSTTARNTSLFALVSSSNPNVIAVPASVTISGNKANIPATIPPAAQSGATTTISVSLDGATVTLPVTVQLPRPTAISFYRDRFNDQLTTGLPTARVRAVATFNGSLAPSAGANIQSSDTALRPISPPQGSTAGLSADGRQFTRFFEVTPGLAQARNAPVVVSASGTEFTATFSMTHIAISSVTATPAAGTAGSTLSTTVLVAPTPLVGMNLSLASADTSRAEVQATSSSLAAGATSKVFSVLLKGPVSTPRQVPITATLKNGTVIVSQQTIVVTVNP